MRVAENNHPKPSVGIMIGDPCGIGPEVVAKAWASGKLHAVCRPVLVGSASVMTRAARIAGLQCESQVVSDIASCAGHAGMMDVMEPYGYDVRDQRYGFDTEASGKACGAWLTHLDRLAREGLFAATVMGPISSEAMQRADTLATIATNKAERAYLLLRSGPLVIAHLSDHMPLANVNSAITSESVLSLVRVLDEAMKAWGIGSRRIAVAGFNPHAHGREEDDAIAPAIELACAEGRTVAGPVSPDSIFRHCIEGRHDVAVAMYHDQGHIAMKTWGFSGNSVVFLGPPYVHTTVAHGVAYEIAGRGLADESMILNAILNAASLAAGNGFHD
jgi:4-hydroxythreonine-4-phosphate dehydrogenase